MAPNRRADLGHALTNGPEAHNPQRLTGQFHQTAAHEREVNRPRPLAVVDRSVMRANGIGQFQQQRKNMLCHGVRTVGGHVGNDDSPAASR
jgi:hypothetical protein